MVSRLVVKRKSTRMPNDFSKKILPINEEVADLSEVIDEVSKTHFIYIQSQWLFEKKGKN